MMDVSVRECQVLNLYTETAEPGQPTPPLDGDRRAAVVVIGGGFTGLSAALHLALRGIEVVLLEAEEPGFGASGRNGGQVNPGLKPDPDEVLKAHGADLGVRMLAFAGTAPDIVFDLITRHRISCDARRCGTLRAAAHPRHVAAVRTTTEQYQRLGAPMEFLSREAIAAATGTGRYHGAMLDRRGGVVQPLSFARGLARAAIGAGAVLHGRTRVRALVQGRDGWYARCATGSVAATQVLIATNGYTDDLWPGLRRSIVPVFSSIAATAPLPVEVARAIMPGGQVLYESGAVTVYYRMDSARRLLIGGRGPTREIGSAAQIGYILRYARRLWPALAEASWTHAWGGQLAITPDHYPHVHEGAPGVWIALGYNGRGVALATALGAQLARRIADPTALLDLPVSPIRPIVLHGLWPLGVKAALAHGRVSDYFGF
jgi:glycine/D-amino acid oxidase-like deaminating enzyme